MNEDILEIFHAMKLPENHPAAVNPIIRQCVEQQITLFPCWVLPSIDEPACVCGIIPFNGVGEIWMIPSCDFKRKAPIVYRQIQIMIETLYSVFELHRLHMFVRPNDKKSILWAERLGFIQEALLTRIGSDGGDRLMYLYPEK